MKAIAHVGSQAAKPRAYRLRLIEKRSIVYARLPAEMRKFQPKKVAYIPYATMAWIENLLAKGETEWPWFDAVLKFIDSGAYRQIEAQLTEEIDQMKAAKKAFYDGFKSFSAPKPGGLVTSQPSIGSSWPNPRPRGDRPYFWETVDSSAWREQE